MPNGVERIRAERRRQRSRQSDGERYSLSHDQHHDQGELARAAAAYALPPEIRDKMIVDTTFARVIWPGSPYRRWEFKPSPNDRVHELTKAGALIAAEIDRLLAIDGDDA